MKILKIDLHIVELLYFIRNTPTFFVWAYHLMKQTIGFMTILILVRDLK